HYIVGINIQARFQIILVGLGIPLNVVITDNCEDCLCILERRVASTLYSQTIQLGIVRISSTHVSVVITRSHHLNHLGDNAVCIGVNLVDVTNDLLLVKVTASIYAALRILSISVVLTILSQGLAVRLVNLQV